MATALPTQPISANINVSVADFGKLQSFLDTLKANPDITIVCVQAGPASY